ncbi:MAG TPA: type II toxin-antitoxin system RelB/DinJ family antitoxin [Patescibacteria group bacterium]|nr:type II toxin-antitoxin system RelB/DinJ family antitoxin [Patescibacteria group bacterium]
MTSIINIKTDQKIKERAQKAAEDLGLSLSAVINAYLRQFVRTQTLFVSNKFSEPSALLLSALAEARAERKSGKQHAFKNNTEALKFVEKIVAKKK